MESVPLNEIGKNHQRTLLFIELKENCFIKSVFLMLYSFLPRTGESRAEILQSNKKFNYVHTNEGAV